MRFLKSLLFNKLIAPSRLKLFVWLSLITQILIVVTGGAVRLTASGLGCPTWPKCTEESLVTTPEMGFHGVIEFGNRLLTFVLLIIALLTFMVVVRLHRSTKALVGPAVGFFAGVFILAAALLSNGLFGFNAWVLALFIAAAALMLILGARLVMIARAGERHGLVLPAFFLGVGIIVQAVIGGITVLMGLNPWIVGFHFVVSGVLIALAAVLYWRTFDRGGADVAPLARKLAWPTLLVGALTVLIGVLVTGAGPHAGDALTPRNGLDLEIWQHFHSYPAYLMLALVVLQLGSQWRLSRKLWFDFPTRILLFLLITSIAQAVIGVVQARLGVPELLVGLHMLGAAVLCALLMLQWLSLKNRPTWSRAQ